MLVPLLSLTLIVTLPWPGLRVLMRSIPAFVGASSESNLWGAPAEFSFPLLAAAIAVIVPIFSLICFSLIPRSACRLVSRKLRQRDSCLHPQCPGQFAGNPPVYAALLFLSASGDVVPGRGPADGFFAMEAAAATLVNGPRFYGHGWPAEPRY